MTTVQRILAETKTYDTPFVSKARKPWMQQSEESRVISSVVQDVRRQRNIIARGAIAGAC